MSTPSKTRPTFRTEDEEREFWANHSPLDHFNLKTAKRASFPNLRPTLRSISIRLPEGMLDDLKVLANKRDVPYQSLAKLYLAWGIQAERGTTGLESLPSKAAKRMARPRRSVKRSP
jgi:predicted DNA binding CopG/RHH family protein